MNPYREPNGSSDEPRQWNVYGPFGLVGMGPWSKDRAQELCDDLNENSAARQRCKIASKRVLAYGPLPYHIEPVRDSA